MPLLGATRNPPFDLGLILALIKGRYRNSTRLHFKAEPNSPLCRYNGSQMNEALNLRLLDKRPLSYCFLYSLKKIKACFLNVQTAKSLVKVLVSA